MWKRIAPRFCKMVPRTLITYYTTDENDIVALERDTTTEL